MTGPKIANAQIVRIVKGLTDMVDVVGAGGNSVTASGSTITVSGATPSGTMILGDPNDTTLIGAGYSELGPSHDVWQATATTGAPSARSHHTAVWTGTEMIVWGGSGFADDGGLYDPVANSWMATSLVGVPSGRVRHTAVWTGSRMIVWGGYDGTWTDTGGRLTLLSLYRKN